MADRDRTRRPTLSELAKSLGLYDADVWQAVKPKWDAMAWDSWGEPVVELRARTRRAAEAGLRAALEALPARKEGKR